MNTKFYLLVILLLLSSCQSEVQVVEADTYVLVDSDRTGLKFSNNLPVNLDLNIFNYMYYYNGGGVGVGDLNNDGLQDIVLSSNLDQEAVYINRGELHFEDVSSLAQVDGGPNSWTNGVSLVDINNDGLLDIYLAQVGKYRNLDCKNKLFVCTAINADGVPSYKEEAASYGLDFKGFSTQAGFFDYDKDGDLDMYLMNHSLHHNGTFGQRKEFVGKVSAVSGDKLYRNDSGQFVDVTLEAGIESTVIGYGLGLAFGDVNNDGYPDIYIGNDFHENDYLYINQQNGTFKEDLTNQIKHTSRFSMGVDIADINNDGFQDIVSLDMLPEDPVILKMSEGEDALDIFNFKLGYGYNHQYARNNLQLNQGNGSFKEIGAYAGIHATDWSWTPLFFDMNMDGYKDLFISNGIPKRMNDIDYINYVSGKDVQYKIQFDHLEEEDLKTLDKIPEIKLYNKFYLGSQALKFQDQKISNHQLSYSNSAAYADFDNDGDYDLIANNIDQEVFLYENVGNRGSSITIDLEGPKNNKAAIGAKVICTYADKTIAREYYPTRGFQSSMHNKILVPSDSLREVTVSWPNGGAETQTFSGENLTFSFANNKQVAIEEKSNQDYVVSDLTEQSGIAYLHDENPFVEFNREPLIPFSTSSDGPALAVGDVNGDGLADVYLGSSKRRKSGFYLQQKDGSFLAESLNGLASDTIYEEVDAQFVDVDGDNDLDLVVATGGNEYRLNSTYTQPLLYLNEGGRLTRDENAFDGLHLTASCVLVLDANGDGYNDLFFGGRAVPWSYGKVPQSYLMINDGKGVFSDQTLDYFASRELGFIKDAALADINGDGQDDLILASEWAPITVYSKSSGGYKAKAISDEQGWWSSVLVSDVDNDGDNDVFAGNIGLNTRFNPSKKEPVTLYYNDFDDNDVHEQVLTYFVQGRELPFSNMMELQKQIPALKKKYLYAKDFASANINELFGADKIKAAQRYTANHFGSSLYINDGKGNFTKGNLPQELQFSSCNTAIAMDVNADGYMDIIPGGNYHYCNVQMGRYDADNGSVLLNEKGKGFRYRNLQGRPLKSQVSHIVALKGGNEKLIIATQNNGPLKVLEFN